MIDMLNITQRKPWTEVVERRIDPKKKQLEYYDFRKMTLKTTFRFSLNWERFTVLWIKVELAKAILERGYNTCYTKISSVRNFTLS